MFDQSYASDKFENFSEEELWAAFTDDNRKALSALFLKCYDRLFRYGMQILSNEESVKDAIQTLFFRLWKKRDTLTSPNSVYGYLFVSLRRILIRSIRKTKAKDRRNMDFVNYSLNNVRSVEELLIHQEEKERRKELFYFALQSLTLRQKEALLLRINSGMSNGEIARILNISDKRARNIIYEATKRLKGEIYKLTE